MQLSNIDVIIIGAYLVFSLLIGTLLSKRAGKSLEEFFLGGRKLPWYLAGISMVATTFAADTPLWVCGVIASDGISGNWVWWNFLIGGMLTVFFFSRLWRRAEVLTELEFIEFRYSGPIAAFLRGFKAVYLGVFLNVIIIGWVNYAMITILMVFFGIEHMTAYWCVGGLMLLVALYSSLSGLLGVAVTDVVQFFLAMGGCIVLAFILLDLPEIGGLSGLKAQLSESTLRFWPEIGGLNATGVLTISAGAFFAHAMVQWWSAWYPGAEPGGGGYVAQRMMSTKDERSATKATLLFQVLHYAVRPWPWIIVGLCALVLYPELSMPGNNPEHGFVHAMKDHLPNGLKGLLVAAFLAAYMSTISTQLNWGAAFLTNDLYKRFLSKGRNSRNEERLEIDSSEVRSGNGISDVLVGRFSTVLIMFVAFVVTYRITSIMSTFNFLIECSAGIGLVLILRWYWWRVNAVSELAATLAPFLGYAIAHYYFDWAFPESFLFITGFTSVSWLIATFISNPTDAETLDRFYRKVRPSGAWSIVAERCGVDSPDSLVKQFSSWVCATCMVYALLIGTGKLILSEHQDAGICLLIAAISAVLLSKLMPQGYSLSNAESLGKGSEQG